MKHVSIELSMKGQVVRAALPLDSLVLTRAHLLDNPRQWDEDYIAVPWGVSQLIPSGVLGWAAFFQKAPTPEMAARHIFNAIDFDLPAAASAEGVFAAWMDRVCPLGYLWQEDRETMLEALTRLNAELADFAEYRRLAA